MSVCVHGDLDLYASGVCRPCTRARMKEYARKKKLGLPTARVKRDPGPRTPKVCATCGATRSWDAHGVRCMKCAKNASNEKLKQGKDAAEWAAIYQTIANRKPKSKSGV